MSLRFLSRPAIYLLNRLKYPQKFALLSGVFLVPLGLAFYLLLSEIQNRVDFARREIEGLRYLRSLQDLNNALLNFSPPGDRAALEEAWRRLQSADAETGATLETALPLRTLTQEWQAWQSQPQKLNPWELMEAPLQRLRRRVGDQSNLILDPDLDSYYLMEATLLTLPQIQSNLGKIQRILAADTASELNIWRRAQLLARRENLIQLTQTLENGFQVVFQRAPSQVLSGSLKPQLAAQVQANRQLIRALETLLNAQSAPQTEVLFAGNQAALEASAALWQSGAENLETLLQRRIDRLRRRQQLLSVLVLAALALAAYLFIGFYESLMITLEQLRQASLRLVAGNQSQNWALDTRDEMGEVVQSFQTLADALRVAEAKYRGIVENAVVGIYQTSLGGQYLTVNTRLAQIYGYDSPQALMTSLQDIQGQLYVQPRRRQEFIESLRENGSLRNFESQVYRRDGSAIWISESARCLYDDRGELTGFEGTVMDISQRKADELEIERLTRSLQDDNLRLGAELAVTRRLQQLLMPSERELESVAGLDIAGFMEPADEVGGDYYDIQQANGKTRISIGDVTGHGLESNLVMIMAQTAVRTLLENGETDPARLLNAVNRTLYDNIRRMGSYKNMTLMLLEYEAGILRLSGQHEELIIVRRSGQVENIDTFELGFPLGLESDITHLVSETTLQLKSGDLAALYTDGITEAMNPQKEQYGLERLQKVLAQNRHLTAEDIRQAVIRDVRDWIKTQKVFDDITLVILKQQ
ncbi:MAG: SpoIIE family protein phosphatase [Cyanobacteria bacterium RI_101]|nr:SpoIIE family protein phosphatase [Cyanobacteria bacterium RI_101]